MCRTRVPGGMIGCPVSCPPGSIVSLSLWNKITSGFGLDSGDDSYNVQYKIETFKSEPRAAPPRECRGKKRTHFYKKRGGKGGSTACKTTNKKEANNKQKDVFVFWASCRGWAEREPTRFGARGEQTTKTRAKISKTTFAFLFEYISTAVGDTSKHVRLCATRFSEV